MKILICDDDNLSLRLNEVMVEEFLNSRKIQNSEILVRKKIDIESDEEVLKNVDVAFLDIDLNDELNGLKIAQLIKKHNPYVALVFITSYDNYALDAWKLHSFGFLQKPVNVDDFTEVFQKVILHMNGLRVSKMNRMVNLHTKISVKERDIICVEKIADTKDVRVTTNNRTFEFRGTTKDIEKMLCNSFVRISRQVLINVHYIYRIENGVVELSNRKVFMVSYSKEREIKKLCNNLKI